MQQKIFDVCTKKSLSISFVYRVMDSINSLLTILLVNLTTSPIDSTYTNEQKVAQANFEFGLDMYKQMTTKFGSIFLSPLSISTALGMVYFDAEGKTKTNMKAVMKWASADSFLHESINMTMANHQQWQ